MAVLTANSHLLCKDLCYRDQSIANSGYLSSSSFGQLSVPNLWNRTRENRRQRGWRSEVSPQSYWGEISRPDSIEMEAITGTEQFDEVLQQAKETSQPIIVDWVADWCRKCIYLRPKLEKLASEYHQSQERGILLCMSSTSKITPRGLQSFACPAFALTMNPSLLVQFYYVDVNKVSKTLVKRGNILLWKDEEMKEEVIGGHKAWIVIDEVREMIEKHI